MGSETRLTVCCMIGLGSGLLSGALDQSILFTIGLTVILLAFVITLDETRK